MDFVAVDSKVIRQLPETEMLHVPARSPVNWWMRQPGGPSSPSMVSTLSKAVRMRRTRFTRSLRIPRWSLSSIKRFSPLCRTVRILMPQVYGNTVLLLRKNE
jgi:hypothetical protein